MNDNAVVVHQDQQSDSRSIMALVSQAMERPDFDVAKLQALLQIKTEWEKDEARKAYVVALSAFKQDPPKIQKDKQVSFGAGKTAYKHATLDNASELIGAALAQHGLSHRWDVQQLEGGIVKVTCILTHIQGHSESVSMQASPDTSGSKNSIQAIGSTTSYLQRYTLFAATGLAPKDADDDGMQGKQMAESTIAELRDAIDLIPDMAAWEKHWQLIATTCTKAGDVPTYDALKAEMAKKRKALKAAEAI